jgi:D-alanyl-D-alanine carboxypeptidase/D-alanyl-D-alanine-endopeptidase (penicillin-binding protein 4)
MMRTLWSALVFAGAAAFAHAQTPVVHPAFPNGADTPLGRTVASVLADPEVARAHVGVAVVAMDGTPLFGVNEGQLFRPASNAKLFTTATAMAVLGPNDVVKTGVFGELETAGKVSGDLELWGDGDASFGTDDIPYLAPASRPKSVKIKPALQDLETLADQIVAKGIKAVEGRVVGDDERFPWEPYPEGWGSDDLVWGYGAPISALSIADNQLTLTMPAGTISGPKGKETLINGQAVLDDHGVPFYTVVSDVNVTPAGYPARVNVEMKSPRVLRVYGQMPVGAKPDVEEIAIDDPALYAARALQRMLQKRGVKFGAEASSQHTESHYAEGFLANLRRPLDGCEKVLIGVKDGCLDNGEFPAHMGAELGSVASAPLHEDVKFTLKVSQNLHAELMLRRIGRAAFEDGGTAAEGARIVRAFLMRAGIDGDDFVFYDGSGLSTHDLVTPRATTSLLTFAAKQPWFAPWKDALPVGGVDGSLSGRFKDGPLKGHVFAKTGTLGESRALSGYVDCASGKTVAFAIFVDTHLPGHSEGDVIDKIVAAIAANN